MKIAIVSDTHGTRSTVEAALGLITGRGVEVIVHCGDIADGDTVRLFPAGTHFVFGNCDYDREDIETAVGQIGATLHGQWGTLDLDGRKIAFTHGDDRGLLQALEQSDGFDFVFYGHTHVAAEHQVGRTRVINPGALYRAAVKTFVILDVATGDIERVVVEG
jgi:putative phosphoesterase